MTYNIGSFSINYIINKEKKAIFNLIKKICLSKNGYIFGGMVRNEIICSYYKNKFIDYINNNQDINFDIEKNKSISSMFWFKKINLVLMSFLVLKLFWPFHFLRVCALNLEL